MHDANDVTREGDNEMEYEEDSGRVIRRHDNRRCSGRSGSGSYMRSLAIEQQDYRRLNRVTETARMEGGRAECYGECHKE